MTTSSVLPARLSVVGRLAKHTRGDHTHGGLAASPVRVCQGGLIYIEYNTTAKHNSQAQPSTTAKHDRYEHLARCKRARSKHFKELILKTVRILIQFPGVAGEGEFF